MPLVTREVGRRGEMMQLPLLIFPRPGLGTLPRDGDKPNHIFTVHSCPGLETEII